MVNNKALRIAIISPSKDAYSETFIQAHIERLPANVKVLCGGWFPTKAAGKPLLPLYLKAADVALDKFLHLPPYFQARRLRRFLKKNKVDVVLAEYGLTGAAVMDVCDRANVPVVVHFHGFDAYERPVLEQYSSDYRRMFSKAAAFIAVSRDMERQLLDLGAPREKLYYNPYGVDASLFFEANPAEASPLFVAVGRFVDKKAPHLTLLAFKKVFDACPDARLVMIGDGPLWDACKQMAKAMRIAEAVQFTGPRSHTEVAATMQRARAFVQHSIRPGNGDSEGTPVAVLEACTTGLPVIATRHAGIVDVVIEGRTGLLVAEGDVDGMAAHMLKLSREPKLAAILGRHARQHMLCNFSMEQSIERLMNIIRGAIEQK